MVTAAQSPPSRILDFGCGHGRVLRALRAEFPNARITACDIDQDAVDFCVRTFGAEGVYSSPDPREVRFDQEFDLMWLGSVFTHLNLSAWERLLRLLAGSLALGGLVVFTTAGASCAQRLRDGEVNLSLEPEAIESMLRGFDESGFGYGEYPLRIRRDHSSEEYGVTLIDPDRVRSLAATAGLQTVHHIPSGWGVVLQDVFACRAV
jgi:SAM-dependent methyltransferase